MHDAADFQNFRYRKLRYWIVQYRYAGTHTAVNVGGIPVFGIPVLEALAVICWSSEIIAVMHVNCSHCQLCVR